MKQRAIILLSGGLDSTTTLAIAQEMNFEPIAITFDYGQRHKQEIEQARRIAENAGVKEHHIVTIDLTQMGKSALTDNIAVPKSRDEKTMASKIPITYVPARNTIFLSFALGFAEVMQSNHIFIGVNVVDYSGYPDCRPEFIKAFETMANLATKAGVEERRALKIHTPLIEMTKAEIIQKGVALGVDYALTRTCYDPSPNDKACGECDACKLRRKGFEQAGLVDPIEYENDKSQ